VEWFETKYKQHKNGDSPEVFARKDGFNTALDEIKAYLQANQTKE
jgi:hypothetical protein